MYNYYSNIPIGLNNGQTKNEMKQGTMIYNT